MKDSEAYKQYYAVESGAEPPKAKIKYKKKADESDTSPKKKTPPATKGSRIKTSAKVAKSIKKKQPAKKPITKGLTVLSKVALSEAEQLKMATKRSKIQFHSSHARAGDEPEVPDVPKYTSESEEESWTFSQGDDNDADEESDTNDDSEETESDDDGDDFVHPNLSTYNTDDHEVTKEDENQEGDDYIKEGGEEGEQEYELYRDMNINLERSDAEMTNAQANQETDDAHVTLTAEPLVVQQQSSSVSSDLVSKYINPSPDTGIYSILNVQSHNLVNVLVFVAAVTPYSDTTTPQPPIPIIQPLQQTPASTTTTTNPTMTLLEIPNFASLFGFDQKVSALETEMSEFKQINQFAEDISSIPGIVDNYLTSKMKYAVDVAVQLQSNKLREEDQAENQEFLNQIDSNIKAIIKDQVKAQVSKIMPKVEKDILTSYGDVVTLKRGRDDQDKDEDPSTGSNRESKRRRSGKEAKSSKEPTHTEPKSTSSSKVFKATNDQLDWHNPKGRPYPHDLSKPLPLIPNARGRQVIPFDHFINNDLEYMKGGSLCQRYTTSITKTKAADYGQVKWIKDKVPGSIWSPVQVVYDKNAYWGTYHWGLKRQKFYGYTAKHGNFKRCLLKTQDYCSNQPQDLAVFWLQSFGRDHCSKTGRLAI
ncbi:hypothetical protein Tco_0585988 [Tanacetum coccineum]